MTGDTALRLARWFGASARFWLNLQSAYDIRTAEERVGQEIEKLPQRQAAVADKPRETAGDENADAALTALSKALMVTDLTQFRKPTAKKATDKRAEPRMAEADPVAPKVPNEEQRKASPKKAYAVKKRRAERTRGEGDGRQATGIAQEMFRSSAARHGWPAFAS